MMVLLAEGTHSIVSAFSTVEIYDHAELSSISGWGSGEGGALILCIDGAWTQFHADGRGEGPRHYMRNNLSGSGDGEGWGY